MVHIVTHENRDAFKTPIAGMHRDRKRIFVDWLKWDLPVVDQDSEIDQFDNSDAIYLIESDRKTGKHLASLRLLPSQKPHLLSHVFPDLCDGPVPCGEDVMEITRYCVSPDVAKADVPVYQRHIWVAAVEYALLFGVEHYTAVSHKSFLDTMMSAGWGTRRLGKDRGVGSQQIGAMLLSVSPATMRECRRRFGYRQPLLELQPVADAA